MFLECLEKIFLKLVKEHLSLKLSKCFFGYDTVKYLRNVIRGDDIALNQDKVRVVRDFPKEGFRKAVRSFIVLAGY